MLLHLLADSTMMRWPLFSEGLDKGVFFVEGGTFVSSAFSAIIGAFFVEGGFVSDAEGATGSDVVFFLGPII
jgi:hypothetical protein